MAGHHFLNSISQLIIIVVGTIIKCGPQIPFSQARWAIVAIVWMVLPSPISSASMPLILLLCKVTSQSSPICWYSLNSFLSRKGTFVLTAEAFKVIPLGCKASAKTAWSVKFCSTSGSQTHNSPFWFLLMKIVNSSSSVNPVIAGL